MENLNEAESPQANDEFLFLLIWGNTSFLTPTIKLVSETEEIDRENYFDLKGVSFNFT